VKILILSEEDIKKVFTIEDAICAAKDALEIYSKGESFIPLRTNIDVTEKEGHSLYMPGYAAKGNALGVKIVTVYPHNVHKGIGSVLSTMVLQNEDTGEVNAIIDGTYLTKIRTAAVSGAATDLLAKKKSKIFAMFGTGGQAESQLEAVLAVRNIKEVRLFGVNREKTKAFTKKMDAKFQGKYNVKFVDAESSDAAIVDADIITSVTTSKKPTFNGKLVKKGVHINGIGSYTPDMHEIDEFILLNAGKVYVDTRDGVLNESGDFIIPVNEGKCTDDIITGELGDLILGRTPRRENEEEITFFKSVGSGILDVVTARRIYEKAAINKVGQVIEF